MVLKDVIDSGLGGQRSEYCSGRGSRRLGSLHSAHGCRRRCFARVISLHYFCCDLVRGAGVHNEVEENNPILTLGLGSVDRWEISPPVIGPIDNVVTSNI